MFYDERIEYERGLISRNCIIISVFCALIYGTLNLMNMLVCLEAPGFRQFFHLGIEAVIILSGIFCLSIGFFKGLFAKDERARAERNIFYNKAAIVHLCAALIAWALLMPFAIVYPLPSINFLAFPYDYGMFLLFFPIVTHCVYSFKKHEIYFNYSILESEHYYKNVFKNIGKFAGYTLALLLLSLLGLSAVFVIQIDSLQSHEILVYTLSIFLTYIFTFVLTAGLYLFLSMLEKSSYDNETRLISKATVISFLTVACLALLVSVIAFFSVNFINMLINESILNGTYITISKVTAAINLLISSIESFIFLALILSITYFGYEYRRAKKNRLLSGAFGVILIIKSLGGFFSACFRLFQIIVIDLEKSNNYYIENELSNIYLNITYLINFIEVLALVLIVIALIKDKTISKYNIASLAALAVLFGVMVFLSTQLVATEFSQARAIFSAVVYVYCAVIVAFLSRKNIHSIDK